VNKPVEVHMRETIVRLLSGMGGAREIKHYLKRFSQLDSRRFAVVKVGGAILRDDMKALASALAFLQQVGLTPIVVHGAGPQLDEALAEKGIEREVVNGLRVTGPEALAVVRRVFQQQNLRLVEALHEMSARATSVVSGVFNASYVDRQSCGLVGQVDSVNLEPIEACLRLSSIPVITSLGETPAGQILNINADYAAHALVGVVRPDKIIFLTGTGGLLDGDGDIIDSINLATDYERLMAEPWLHGGMRLKLQQIAGLLETLPLESSVSITRPAQLARELFTWKGSGTLVRRGERVLHFSGWQGVDKARLRELFESAFRRRLVDSYFDLTRPVHVFVTENYRAAMVIVDQGGRPYLDKFAVLAEAQGEGLGRAVWKQARQACGQLFWRSRQDNAINGFYAGECDGFIRSGRWNVYWFGLPDMGSIDACVRLAAGLAPTLEERA